MRVSGTRLLNTDRAKVSKVRTRLIRSALSGVATPLITMLTKAAVSSSMRSFPTGANSYSDSSIQHYGLCNRIIVRTYISTYIQVGVYKCATSPLSKITNSLPQNHVRHNAMLIVKKKKDAINIDS
jgi:hypothetical protein